MDVSLSLLFQQLPVAVGVPASRQAFFDPGPNKRIDRLLSLLVQGLEGRPAHQYHVVGSRRFGGIPPTQSQDGADLGSRDGALVPPDPVQILDVVPVDGNRARVARPAVDGEGTADEFLLPCRELLINLVANVPPHAFSCEGVLNGFLSQFAEGNRRERLIFNAMQMVKGNG